MRRGDFLLEDVPGGLPAAGGDFADVVVVKLVGEGFFEEVSEGIEVVAVEELAFDGSVEGFHFGVGVIAARWDVAVVGAEEVFDGEHEAAIGFADGLAIELGTVVGLDGEGSEIHAAVSEGGEPGSRS